MQKSAPSLGRILIAAAREALLGSTFDTRNTSSRRPSIALATSGSASPYISAISGGSPTR